MKNSTVRVKKMDPVEALSGKIDKLHINGSTRRNINQLVPPYDIDRMSFHDLQTSLCKIEEIPSQPFSFLADIRQIFASEDQSLVETKELTEIDTQLAAAAKRIESSKILLEKAKSHVEETRRRVRDNAIRQTSGTHAYHESELK